MNEKELEEQLQEASELLGNEQPTVKSLVQSLHEWTKFDFSKNGEIDEDTIKDCFNSDIELLADLLGIELED